MFNNTRYRYTCCFVQVVVLSAIRGVYLHIYTISKTETWDPLYLAKTKTDIMSPRKQIVLSSVLLIGPYIRWECTSYANMMLQLPTCINYYLYGVNVLPEQNGTFRFCLSIIQRITINTTQCMDKQIQVNNNDTK